MNLFCPHCRQRLEYLASLPKFCSSCGEELESGDSTSTIEYDAAGRTPSAVGDAETPLPVAALEGAEEAIPEKVGNYRLLRALGRGGMGAVYEATEITSGRHVALKLVSPQFASSKESVERFRQEGQLASKLSHPRCVFVLAANEDRGRPYIVMELMSGDTLNDLVRDKGPLPPEQAIPKILDVIEGLNEAHQVGLVHRDVKPANCFLEADGRVKIGDFGLAKSLLHDSHLTRTGTFLGTPLFAAPEQIKLEGSAVQDDVYSVAATLYFLLTGQAPFQSGDAMATIARIVSDDPPSMRIIRPELPKALDDVVLRGLARERKNRWRSLEQFRRALVHLLPAEVSVGGLGLRFGAFLIDSFLLSLARQAVFVVLLAVLEVGFPLLAVALVAEVSLPIGYFGILEGLCGWSVGKRILRLRVAKLTTQQPPGVGRALLRAAIIIVLPKIALGVVGLDLVMRYPEQVKFSAQGFALSMESGMKVRDAMFVSAAGVWTVLATIAILSTMRRRNGFRGLHEFASGTRTYLLRWPEVRQRRSLDTGQFLPEMMQPDNLPAKVGSYAIRGAFRWVPQEKVLLGQDQQLGRAVWIWMRPLDERVLGEAHRAVTRATRPRWLACGTFEKEQWDAFLAPTGCPLPALVARNGRLSWAEFRPILQELTEELQASCTDQSLPQSLTPEQVWISPNGHVQLLETTSDNASVTSSQAIPKLVGDQPQALALLGNLAVAALENSSLLTRCESKPIQAPLPLYAAKLVNRLLSNEGSSSGQPQYQHLDQVLADLKATDGQPVEVSSWARAKHLIGQGEYALIGILLIGLLFAIIGRLLPNVSMLLPKGEHVETAIGGTVLASFLIGLVLFFAPAYFMRGGVSFYRAGIAIVLADGRRASRLRCLARAFLAWTVVIVLGLFAWAGVSYLTFLPWNYLIIPAAAVILLAAYLFLTIRSPSRAPHDYVMGTYLVPR